MTNKWFITLVSLAPLAVVLAFAFMMYGMTQSMEAMTGHVATISEDVGEMGQNLRTMNDTMLRMEASIQGIDRSMSVGSQQMQQLNPSGVMEQMFPGQRQQRR